jgi:ubiquinone biosynthesis protein UbiJ
VSSTETKALIAQALERLQAEVPALSRLKLVLRVELRAHGGDTPIWRVEVPGPKVTKDPAGDARVDVSIARPQFNELAAEGTLKDWADAYERGHVKVTGDAAVVKLLGNVLTRARARARA